MKEERFFFVPSAATGTELPLEEAQHALRVLRMKSGDKMMLMDGAGSFYVAEVTVASNHQCLYQIKEQLPQTPQWKGHIHLAIAPTKMMERMEWMAEKVTEVGVDEISFLQCQFSERKVIKSPRIEKIVISAVKQSRKAWKPQVNELRTFRQFISEAACENRFIAHCYDEIERTYLYDELRALPADAETTVLIGPEGDFSIDEVRTAIAAGYTSVYLGQSRLRTETAGLAAVMMMQLSKENKE
ncbi:MAG: 16S rRNA (uracil(1498)-N(3))-methyltransferase [Prevotella sp.]|nr:16S rRNA (uracil(1498)-N(3))-methyltransferase [Prevotella sp.]